MNVLKHVMHLRKEDRIIMYNQAKQTFLVKCLRTFNTIRFSVYFICEFNYMSAANIMSGLNASQWKNI